MTTPLRNLKEKAGIFPHKKHIRNLSRWNTVTQKLPMDTKTADSITRPKNFYQKAKTFDRCPKNMKKRESCYIFFSSLCACGFIKWSFDHRAKLFLSKIRKNLAQVRNWLENENFNFKNFPKKIKRHSKKHFLQLSRKAFAKRWHFFCSMSKNDWKKENFVSKKCFPPKCFHGHRESSFDNLAGKLSTTGGFFRSISGKYKTNT